MNYTAQLKAEGNLLRRPSAKGPSPRKRLARKVRVRKVSKRRQGENREYSVRRKAFLAGRPVCEVFVALNCTRVACDVHHYRRRGKFYLDESTWIPTCRPCHEFIHQHPKEARELGLLA